MHHARDVQAELQVVTACRNRRQYFTYGYLKNHLSQIDHSTSIDIGIVNRVSDETMAIPQVIVPGDFLELVDVVD